MRRIAVLVAVLALLVGCDAVPSSLEEMAEELEARITEGAEGPDEADTDAPGDAAADHDADEEGGSGGSGAPDGGGTDPDQPGETDAGSDGELRIEDNGPVGGNGPAILRGDVPRLVVEIDVQDGLTPNGGALDHLRGVLGREADKPDGVHLTQRSLTSDRREWSAADVRALADQRRQHRSSGDQVAIYVAYLRGSFEGADAIGVAVNASTIAVFPDRWSGTVETVVGSSAAVERAVLVHEVGHLLGLVELTYSSRHDRHDAERPGHSTNRGSVMHWAIATTAVGQVFSGPPPDDFDEMDRDDLRYLRTGSW